MTRRVGVEQLTYGELMMLCEGHGTAKILERHLEVVNHLRRELAKERARVQEIVKAQPKVSGYVEDMLERRALLAALRGKGTG